jgi:hypothetical protein
MRPTLHPAILELSNQTDDTINYCGKTNVFGVTGRNPHASVIAVWAVSVQLSTMRTFLSTRLRPLLELDQ